jgi:hypothetical protein
VEPESGVGIRAESPRRPLFAGRGVLSRDDGPSFSLSEFIEAEGLRTEYEEGRALLSFRGATEGSR